MTVRPAIEADMEEFAARLNTFYHGYNLHQPCTAEELVARAEHVPFDFPLHHTIVATDAAGNLLAGLEIVETCRLRTMHLQHMPGAMRAVNALLGIVPADGVLRELNGHNIWYAPDQLAVGRFLWETVRWQWRDRGTSLLAWSDARSPLLLRLGMRPWTLKAQMSIAISNPVPLSEQRLISPIA